MLYGNAQLARVRSASTPGRSPATSTCAITEEILDYVVRKMTDPAGGFYSAQDADPTPLRSGVDRSKGEEGKFFVWTPDEIRDVLGDKADGFMTAYGVTRHGSFEDRNILEFVSDLEQRLALAEARRKLFEAREKRIHPGRDEKVLASWNGLMLAAFAEAARALDRDDYRKVTERTCHLLLWSRSYFS